MWALKLYKRIASRRMHVGIQGIQDSNYCMQKLDVHYHTSRFETQRMESKEVRSTFPVEILKPSLHIQAAKVESSPCFFALIMRTLSVQHSLECQPKALQIKGSDLQHKRRVCCLHHCISSKVIYYISCTRFTGEESKSRLGEVSAQSAASMSKG